MALRSDPDVLLAHLAGRQAGAFTRRDARQLGFTPRMIDRRRRRGLWRQVFRDVFALTGYPATFEQRCWCATLVHPAAAVSHSTAGVRLGLRGLRTGRVNIAVPPTAGHSWDRVIVHRTRHTQFRLVQRMRTTTFAQTMIQLAEHESDEALRSALRSGFEARPARTEALRKRMGELQGRRLPGFGRLLDQLGVVDGEPPTASELEHRLFEVLQDVPGMPPVERQAVMPWSPDRDVLVDGLVKPWRLIVEGDGRRWHTRVQDFERDRWRDNEAAIHGLHVMRFTWAQVDQRPENVVSQVERYGRRFTHLRRAA